MSPVCPINLALSCETFQSQVTHKSLRFVYCVKISVLLSKTVNKNVNLLQIFTAWGPLKQSKAVIDLWGHWERHGEGRSDALVVIGKKSEKSYAGKGRTCKPHSSSEPAAPSLNQLKVKQQFEQSNKSADFTVRLCPLQASGKNGTLFLHLRLNWKYKTLPVHRRIFPRKARAVQVSEYKNRLCLYSCSKRVCQMHQGCVQMEMFPE